MSILELKQAASQLSKREREELHAYLVRLSHNTPEWKRSTAKRIRMMQSGSVCQRKSWRHASLVAEAAPNLLQACR